MKFLLLIALFFLAVWMLRKIRPSRPASGTPAPRAPERMVRCEYCGVHLPVGESVVAGGRHYCTPAHRDEANRARG